MKKWIPIVLTIVMAVWALSGLFQPAETGFHTREFGRLPVLLDGRFEPFDSVARNSLLQIRTKQTLYLAESNQTHSAVEWLLGVMMTPERADNQQIFRIDNGEVLALLKLPEGQKYYSFSEIRPSLNEIQKQSDRISGVDESKRTPFESQLMKLFNALNVYQRLQLSLKPADTDDFAAELVSFQNSIAPGVAAAQAKNAGQKFDQAAFITFIGYLGKYDTVADYAMPNIIPPSDANMPADNWENMGTNLMEAARVGQISQPAQCYAAMVSAWRADKPADFNQALAKYNIWLADRFAPQVKKARQECVFSTFELFYKAMVIYVLALVLALCSWVNMSPVLRRSAFYLIALGCAIHTFGLLFRMYLEGRPPVTNLYSSAIFIGWGAVILGLVLEKIYRDGVGCVVAAFAGFVTLIIAHNLALSGDTMESMRAVLNSNFWLTTHVITVTLGYASTFVAGFLAIIYVMRGLFTTTLDEQTAKSLSRMVYGIVCFATLFSFIGTVLGGIWADQSWGRFWGWDPKENGALLIVLWNAAILHARWGGFMRERGLMVMAIIGNIVTSWSWFGVNMLGIGLHSYGFTEAAFRWLLIFVASQLAIILLALTPKKMWRSFSTTDGRG
jgi:ABC-type transport system involved in cytochrome c biogenesis permease subunit